MTWALSKNYVNDTCEKENVRHTADAFLIGLKGREYIFYDVS